MRFIATLKDLPPEQWGEVGAKAAHCARLLQAGIDVPDGFVVCVEGTPGPLPPDALDEALRACSGEGRFAVRSSGADEDGPRHSFAGVYETVLDVPREQVAEAVARCWQSLHAPRAEAYRSARGLSATSGPHGVLVQRMVRASVAGVAFTRDPVSGAHDEIRINACPGLGERLMDGQVEPDEFRLRKRDGVILESRRGRSGDPGPALSPSRLNRLREILLRVEAELGGPQDVEWCFDGRAFWIVQARPVTAISSPLAPAPPDRSTPAAGLRIEWTRANVREVLPDLPSPQALQAMLVVVAGAMRRFYGRLLAPDDVLGPPVQSFMGRPYFNLTQFRHLCKMTGNAPNHILELVGHAEELRPEDDRVERPRLGEFLAGLPDAVRLLSVMVTVGPLIGRHLERTAGWLGRLQALDPRVMSDVSLLREVGAWIAEGPRALETAFALSVTTLYRRWLARLLRRAGLAPDDAINVWLAAGPKTVSAQQALDLLAVARVARGEVAPRAFFAGDAALSDWRAALAGTAFAREFDGFLDRYGHRGSYESDWALPRYHEDPTPLLFAVRAQVRADACADPEELRARQEAAASRLWRELRDRLRGPGRWLLPPLVRWLLVRVRQMYLLRERNRFEMVRVLAELRRFHLELADRLAARGCLDAPADYFWLELDEVRALTVEREAPDARRVVAERKALWEDWRGVEMPLYMKLPFGWKTPAPADHPPGWEEPVPPTANGALRGQCVSPGCVEAEVVVLREPGEFARMRRGAILVAPATDPSWTPLFTMAAGVIVEIGGSLSHASTIARELSLPALANVRDATRRLRDGDRVRLDATHGKVELL